MKLHWLYVSYYKLQPTMFGRPDGSWTTAYFGIPFGDIVQYNFRVFNSMHTKVT